MMTLDAPTVETGTGSNTCNVLGCAEALRFLGIGPADIHWVKVVDTDVSSKDCVQTDSAVSYLQSEVMAVADMPYLPLHHQLIVWSMSDKVTIPIFANDSPNFKYSKMK